MCSMMFHPQTDGEIEVVNKSIEAYLCCVSRDTPIRWIEYLSLI